MTEVFLSVQRYDWCAPLSHPSSCVLVNHGPSQQSSKEEYKLWKWGSTTRYYASRTKTMLPTSKAMPRSSRQLDHTKTSWPSWRDATCSGMDTSPIHQVWPKPSCKAQWKGEEDNADRGRGGKTTSGNGQAWSSPSPRGQWRTGKNGGNWLWNHLWRPNNSSDYGIDDNDDDMKHNFKKQTSIPEIHKDTSGLKSQLIHWPHNQLLKSFFFHFLALH